LETSSGLETYELVVAVRREVLDLRPLTERSHRLCCTRSDFDVARVMGIFDPTVSISVAEPLSAVQQSKA
jgi:hypothetical protein